MGCKAIALIRSFRGHKLEMREFYESEKNPCHLQDQIIINDKGNVWIFFLKSY